LNFASNRTRTARRSSGSRRRQADREDSIDEYLSSVNLKELERRAILATLKKHQGRRDKTADALGISKRGLLNKLNEYNIH